VDIEGLLGGLSFLIKELNDWNDGNGFFNEEVLKT
jgi:hypothetical protein